MIHFVGILLSNYFTVQSLKISQKRVELFHYHVQIFYFKIFEPNTNLPYQYLGFIFFAEIIKNE